MNTWTIAKLTFREAARRKILLAALALGLLFLTVYGLGFHYIMKDVERSVLGGEQRLMISQISNFILTAGMYVVNSLTVMMTVLTSVDTLSGEISSGTIHTLISKPMRRWEVVTGKWLGFAGMLSVYLLMMGGGVALLVYLRSGYTAPHPWQALAFMWLNSLLLLSVSLWGGAGLSTLANGVLVFGLFGVAFIGGWIETVGGFMPDAATTRTAVNIGVITSLVMPSEALWKSAAFAIQSPLLASIGTTPFTARFVPSTLMIVYSLLYLVAALILAIRRFNSRDL